MDVKFYMMDNLSDPLILGFPELSSLGCYVEPQDEAGRRWMQLSQAGPGLRLPILSPELSRGTKISVVKTTHLTGPNSTLAWLSLSSGEYKHAVE